MTVTVTTEAFAAGSGVVNASGPAAYSRPVLVGFTLTAGRPWVLSGGLVGWPGWGPAPANLAAFVANEALELGGLTSVLLSYLEQPPGGPVSGTEYLHLLEKTEKGQAAARLGSGATALLAWDVLGVSALHHVAHAGPGVLFPPPGPATQRPDFFGRPGPLTAYSTFEAKGTTGGAPGPAAKAAAKVQATAFTTIAGTPVGFCTACFGRFPQAPGIVEATMVDPPVPDDGEELPADLVGHRELELYGPVGRAIAADRPSVTLPAQTGAEQSVELFAMGTAGFFGAVAPVANAIRAVLNADPSDLAVAEAGAMLETSRAGFVDHRLPAVREASPGERRRGDRVSRGEGDDSGTASGTAVVIDGDPCELVVLPNGLALALRQDLLGGGEPSEA